MSSRIASGLVDACGRITVLPSRETRKTQKFHPRKGRRRRRRRRGGGSGTPGGCRRRSPSPSRRRGSRVYLARTHAAPRPRRRAPASRIALHGNARHSRPRWPSSLCSATSSLYHCDVLPHSEATFTHASGTTPGEARHVDDRVALRAAAAQLAEARRRLPRRVAHPVLRVLRRAADDRLHRLAAHPLAHGRGRRVAELGGEQAPLRAALDQGLSASSPPPPWRTRRIVCWCSASLVLRIHSLSGGQVPWERTQLADGDSASSCRPWFPRRG